MKDSARSPLLWPMGPRRRRRRPMRLLIGALACLVGFSVVFGSSSFESARGWNAKLGSSWFWRMLGFGSVVDPIFEKFLNDEIGRLHDPTAMMEDMMHAMQNVDQDILSRQEAERIEELTHFHEPTLRRIFRKYDRNRDGFLDANEVLHILQEWSRRSEHWLPVILMKTTVETVNLAKAQAKAQGKPIPASANRNFKVAKVQIANFANNFFIYSNPFVLSSEVAAAFVSEMKTTENGVSLEDFTRHFISVMHVARYDIEGIMSKLQQFVADGIRAEIPANPNAHPTGPTQHVPSVSDERTNIEKAQDASKANVDFKSRVSEDDILGEASPEEAAASTTSN